MSKPEALELAEYHDGLADIPPASPDNGYIRRTAACLRRLHAENETLRKQHLDAHNNTSVIFGALVQISMLTHLGGEVAEYGDVVDAVRRLHAENERLHQINQSHEMKLSVRGYEIQIEDLRLAHAELRERNAELLEALERIAGFTLSQFMGPYDMALECINVARAAIARAEGEKG